MIFNNAGKFKEVIRKYASEGQFQLKKTKNEVRRVRMKCKSKDSPWGIFASKKLEVVTL